MMLIMLYDTVWFLHSRGKINSRHSQDLLLANVVGTTLGVFIFCLSKIYFRRYGVMLMLQRGR